VRALAALAIASACTAEEPALDRDALLELSPEVLPSVPPDVSNRVADDARAAAWGQVLFFDPGFSGTLLDSDNDLFHGGVGLQGETGKVSCASCHVPEDGFVDTRSKFQQISLASGWTRRRTPSVLDVGHATLLMWDGRFDSLQRQVLGVIESPMEANSSRLFFAQEIARRYAADYQTLFGTDPRVVLGTDYPQLAASETGCLMALTKTTTPDDGCTAGTRRGMPGDGADYDSLTLAQQHAVTTIAMNAAKAIAAYERLLSCGPSRFDAYMRGDDSALSAAEVRGAGLFVGKAKCADCHSGPFLSDQQFHNVGLNPVPVAVAFLDRDDAGALVGHAQVRTDPLNVAGAFSDGDDGRLPEAPPDSMRGAFRTPMLRCVASRPSFMHTAQLRDLRDVVAFHNDGGHAPDAVPGYLGANELAPLGLTDDEVDDLTAFLRALDGPGPDPSLLRRPN
jgi:cytochrome c peroxidase